MRPVLLLALLIASAAAPAQTSKPAPKPSPKVQKLLDEADNLSDRACLPKLQEAYDTALRLKDRAGEGLALVGLGACHYALSQYKQALGEFERALPIMLQIGDRSGEATVLHKFGMVYEAVGQRQRALDFYSQALPIEREVGDRSLEAATLDNIGLVYDDLGQKHRALDLYNQALPIEREVGDRSGEAVTLCNIGGAYAALGQEQRALDFFDRALPIEREVGDRSGEAAILTNIGAVYAALGQKQRALDFYNQALPIEREVGDRYGEAATLSHIGAVYDDLGQKHRALDLYNQALPIRRKIGDRSGEAAALNNIGKVYDDLGQRQRALDFYSRALLIEREVGDRSAEATVLNNIGKVYDDLGQKQRALEYYNQALPIRREVGDRSGEATTLNNIGSIYAALGQDQRALDFYNEALPIHREVGDRSDEATALNNIGFVYAALGSLPLAVAFGKQSVNVYQSLRADIKGLDQASKSSFRDSVASTYRQLADWLAEAGRLTEAQRVLELLKDEEFFEFIRRRAGEESETVDLTPREAAWIAQYDRLGDRLAADAAERDRLLKIAAEARTPAQASRLAALRPEIDAAGKAFAAFLAGAKAAFLAKGASTDRLEDLKGGLVLHDTLAQLPGTAAIYTLTAADGVRVIVNTPGFAAPRSAKTKVSAADLNKKILAFRQALSDPRVDPRPLGAELYDVLVRPVEKDLTGAGIKTLMWSLDGALRYVPLWALYDAQTKQYLIEKYPSCLFTPRTVAGLLAKPRPWTGAEFGVTRGGKVGDANFSPLPGVASELAGVHRALGGPEPRLDDAFTLDALRDALDNRPPVVHVATHFRFKPGDDAGSVLLLGRNQTLSVEALRDMSTDALRGVDLFVLSACETEMGGDPDGSEFEGLALLAQLKGAGAVLATLWPVADESTALLMGEFYRLRKSHPEWNKLEALRQAQLEMLRGQLASAHSTPTTRSEFGNSTTGNPAGPPWPSGLPKYAHPYYWAPFVLTGNWQ